MDAHDQPDENDPVAPQPAPAEGAGTSGLEPNVASGLSYLVMPLTGLIFFLIEKRDQTVRFNAAQSIVVGGGLIVLWVVSSILGIVLGLIPVLGAIIAFLIWLALGLGGFVLWLYLVIQGFQGKQVQLPIASDYARKLMGSNLG